MTGLLAQEQARQPFYTYRGVRFQAVPVSPAETETSLQISCFFQYGKSKEMKGGTRAVDERFGGAIGKLRQDGLFAGDTLQTLLIIPQKREIPAQRLLLIGLGDPAGLSAALFESIGRLAVLEAVKLQVSDFCFAPSILDAGISSLPPGHISGPLIRGMARAIAEASDLHLRGLTPALKLAEAVLLAGPEHLAEAQTGMKATLEKENSR